MRSEKKMTYEKKINKTIYRVTVVNKSEIDFAKAMEELIVRKILKGRHFYGEA
ncbi:MAG: hypothetical protein LBI27_10490 [Clostridiales bacterium]|nr:hypothetical protein [Clostridiales bacterium]